MNNWQNKNNSTTLTAYLTNIIVKMLSQSKQLLTINCLSFHMRKVPEVCHMEYILIFKIELV